MTDPAWEDPALFVDAIVGWRAWHLCRTPEGPTLVPAATGRGAWPARRAYVATCRRPPRGDRRWDGLEHLSPMLACTCGIYASDTLRSLFTPAPRFPPLPVLGTVSLWGRVVEHRRGWRAEFAYPDRLRLVCGQCLSAGDGTGVPSRVVEAQPLAAGGPRIEPLCEDHLAGRVAAGTRVVRDAADVQAELLSRYAVDLLPFEAIESVFRRAPVPGPNALGTSPTSRPVRATSPRPVPAASLPAPVVAPAISTPAVVAPAVARPVVGSPRVTPTPRPTPTPTPRLAPPVPLRTRVVDVVQRIVSAAVTVVFWVFMAWWGCSDMIVTVDGP